MIMENKIVIQNFGPVKEAQINLNKKFQIFIGAQASGKSTICKVVYFCSKYRRKYIFCLKERDAILQKEIPIRYEVEEK